MRCLLPDLNTLPTQWDNTPQMKGGSNPISTVIRGETTSEKVAASPLMAQRTANVFVQEPINQPR